MTKITKTSLLILFSILFAWIITLYFVLLKTDLATQNVNKSTLSTLTAEHKYSPPIALVSYGSGSSIFLSNQITLAESALNKNIQNIYMYNRQNIETEFYNANKHILEQSRGAGYWLWKPYFILKTMEQLPDNSIILYADSGVVFSSEVNEKLLELLQKNDIVMPGNGNPVPLRKHLKKEAQIIMGIENNEKILNSQEIWAYFMAIKNTPSTRKFINKWLELCKNSDLLTDLPFDQSIQETIMESHLHDQSLLSVLVAQEPEKKIILKRHIFRKKLGIDNFHRHEEQKFTSPRMHIAGIQKKIADILYNNFIITTIRKHYF